MAGMLSTMKLKEQLMTKLEETDKLNDLPHRGAFLTMECVDEVLTADCLTEQLKDHPNGQRLSLLSHKTLARTIRDHQKRLYSILLLLDKSNHIHHIPLEEVDKIKDDYLFTPTGTTPKSEFYTQERLNSLTFFDGIASEFYKSRTLSPSYGSVVQYSTA
jgi:hypothetical protein